MAALFADSFDHVTTLSEKWSYVSPSNLSLGAYGRNGTYGVRTTYNSVGLYKTHAQKRTLIAGVAFKIPATMAGLQPLLAFCEAAYNTPQISLQLTSTKYLQIRLGEVNGSTTIATSTNPLADGWHYVEFKAYIDDSAGTTEVHCDGVTLSEMTKTGQDTKNRTNNYADITRVGYSSVSGDNHTFDWDDFYLCDDTGSQANNFLGDIRVEAIFATGAGTYTQWDPSAGSNYDCVNETFTNTTDYVSTAVANEKDTYNFGSITPSSGLIHAVLVNLYAKKDDAGARTIRSYAVSGTFESDGGADIAITESWNVYQQIFHTDPATSTTWDIAGVNAAEFGVKMTA